MKFSVGKCHYPGTRVLRLWLPLLPTVVLRPLRIFVVTYIIQNGVTAVDMATVGERRDIAEVLSAAAEQQQATPTQSSMMTSSSTAKMTAGLATDELTSELPPTQPSASTPDELVVPVDTEQPLPHPVPFISAPTSVPSHPPPSTSPPTPVTSHLPLSTSPPTPVPHPPPSKSPPTPVTSHPPLSTSPPTPVPHPPPSSSPPIPVTSHPQPSTSPPTPPPSHPPPSSSPLTPVPSHPPLSTSPPTPVPSPETTSADTQQSSNQPTSSVGRSFEVCSYIDKKWACLSV